MLSIARVTCEHRKNPMPLGAKTPRFSWVIEGDGRSVVQTAYQMRFALAGDGLENPVFDSGKVESDRSVLVKYTGPALKPCTRYYYQVKAWDNKGRESDWSAVNFFETALPEDYAWKASFITAESDPNPAVYSPAASMFRKEFRVEKEVASARLYSTCHGLYEIHLNGAKVGEDYLTPGWTSYNNRLQYQVYDITKELQSGINAIAAHVGVGWYKGRFGFDGIPDRWGTRTALFAEVHITYTDGTTEIIATDRSWKTAPSPIYQSEITRGESYDARMEQDGWDQGGFDDTGWSEVYIEDADKSVIVPADGVPVRITEKVKPVEIIHTPKGETVIDFGQSIAGWVEFKVRGKKGDHVTIRYGEVLDRDGNFYDDNLRSAIQAVDYILKGDGVEVFRPHFATFGFKYICIDAYPGKVRLDNFMGLELHSEMDFMGHFECSNPLVNKLWQNIVWSQRNCFLDVPLDDPQRDERSGWLGDAHSFSKSAFYNMDVAAFYIKWLKDVKADQEENGSTPFVVPYVNLQDGRPDHNSTFYSDGVLILPWLVYLYTGDLKVLEDQYDSMKKWVGYIQSQSRDGVIWDSGAHFSDWLALDAREGGYVGATDIPYVCTAFYAYDTGLVAKAAKLLGYEEEAKKYDAMYNDILTALRHEYVTPAGRIAADTQTGQVLALMFNLIEDKDRKVAIRRLEDLLVKKPAPMEDFFETFKGEVEVKMTTGWSGTPYICHVLSDNGLNNLAYSLVLRTQFPSWLYQVEKGATTMWEHLDSIKPDGTFWSTGMNSFCQYATGWICDWLFRVMGGIDVDEKAPGFKNVVMRPRPDDRISCATAEYYSPYGQIISSWHKEKHEYVYDITVPANSTATVILPVAATQDLTEGGEVVADRYEAKKIEEEAVEMNIGSGTYQFRWSD